MDRWFLGIFSWKSRNFLQFSGPKNTRKKLDFARFLAKNEARVVFCWTFSKKIRAPKNDWSLDTLGNSTPITASKRSIVLQALWCTCTPALLWRGQQGIFILQSWLATFLLPANRLHYTWFWPIPLHQSFAAAPWGYAEQSIPFTFSGCIFWGHQAGRRICQRCRGTESVHVLWVWCRTFFGQSTTTYHTCTDPSHHIKTVHRHPSCLLGKAYSWYSVTWLLRGIREGIKIVSNMGVSVLPSQTTLEL